MIILIWLLILVLFPAYLAYISNLPILVTFSIVAMVNICAYYVSGRSLTSKILNVFVLSVWLLSIGYLIVSLPKLTGLLLFLGIGQLCGMWFFSKQNSLKKVS